MLTAKQEKFVRNLIQGMSQREAYKRSYDAENMSDESIDVAACRLFNDPKISLRYEELQERLSTVAIMTAQERLEYLTRVVCGMEFEQSLVSVEGEDVIKEFPVEMSAKLKALEIMNKMTGEYVQKIEADVKSDVTINIELSDD